MDKYDIALLRRLRIIGNLIDFELRYYNVKARSLNWFTDSVIYGVKNSIMFKCFKLPIETVFGDKTDEVIELDLKVTQFIENNYINKLNEFYQIHK
jgi:hypothetical protein